MLWRRHGQVNESRELPVSDKHVSFSFVRAQPKDSYSETGPPSIDPELLLRILLIGYLYGISSERKLIEELRMHLPGAGSPASASIRRFPTIPRSPRTDMGGFRNRNCSSSCKIEFQERIYNDHVRLSFLPSLLGWLLAPPTLLGPGSRHCYGITKPL